MSIISPKLLGLFILSALTPLLSYSAFASETKEWPASMASGTLPVIYIDTENNTPIIDKETKIPADLFMTVPPQCAFERACKIRDKRPRQQLMEQFAQKAL